MRRPVLAVHEANRESVALGELCETPPEAGGGITGFGRLFVKYRAGMYERDGKRLFVTTGTGTWGPPLRLGASSELAVLDIGQ